MSQIFDNASNSRIIRINDFSAMEGVSFQYPVFQDWEVKVIEKKNKNEYIIWLNWPGNIKFEVAPQIIIKRMPELGLDYMRKMARRTILEKSIKYLLILSRTIKINPNGELYDFVFDSSLYVKNYNPPEGHWDYLQFYNKNFGVRIWIISASKEVGFDRNLFCTRIIETFNFLNEKKHEKIVIKKKSKSR